MVQKCCTREENKKYILVSKEKHGHRSTDFYTFSSLLLLLPLLESNKGRWDVGWMWEGVFVETKGLTKGK